MTGTMDKVKGTVKEAVGKVTGDRRTEAEGKTDQVKGDVKNAVQDVSESAKGVRDSLRKEDQSH
ncbi:MAG: CsbD family protein [Geminicoccaceae bacterium]